VPVLAAGGRHRFVRDRSAGSILAALRGGTTISFMPPTLVYKLLQEPGLSPDQFAHLRHITYGAAPMPVARIAEAQRAFGPRISALYGQTEAPMTITALGTVEMSDASLRATAGRPCGTSRIRVVDDDGRTLPTGKTGNVEVRGPIVMPGYLDDPALTASTIRDGWLRTGDLGRVDDAGYLTLMGRASEMIITGGFNVYPEEIENILAEAPGVAECCVFGVDDPYWGERIEAVVALTPDASSGAAEIRAFVRERLGSVRTPKTLHLTDSLPRNAVGKVVRRDMPGFVETLIKGSIQHG
jgi:acyl-CoA synthetase (AMP-forming)/AMP-acid ligase II